MSDTDPRRRFNGSERVALYLAADGQCEDCGVALQPGWHADHVQPHNAGGLTDVINGQALCPECNLKKGSRMAATLRAWQAEALEKLLASSHDFLCVATPGAGKTRLALAAAKRLLEKGIVQLIIVVVPTDHLRQQWADAAHRDFGVQLDPKFTNKTVKVADDFDGVVVTYQSVAIAPLVFRRIAAQKRALVILDEVHHGGDEQTWGKALRKAFEAATRRLLLSGTPNRTDGNEVPFVTYEDGYFKADVLYHYGRALADREGVVRLISFPTFDGDARWRDANDVESKLRLSDADEETRARALRSALLPDGPWIRSVFAAANEELSRQRELVPDAGGLVIAADQFSAARYAEIMEQIAGEAPAVAMSDIPKASEIISAFSKGSSRWLIAVAMVSEGVDIPRLLVGVYATNKATRLIFQQVAGRFVRTRGDDDIACASLFIPSVHPLTAYAAEIEKMIPEALKEIDAREAKVGRGSLPFDIVILPPSEAVHIGTILGGDSFSDAELRAAQNVGALAAMPGNVTPAQIARLLRAAGAGQVVGSGTVEIPTEEPSLKERKTTIRKRLQRRVGYLARLRNKPHEYINAELNRLYGDTVATATLDGLELRLVHVERLIAESQG